MLSWGLLLRHQLIHNRPRAAGDKYTRSPYIPTITNHTQLRWVPNVIVAHQKEGSYSRRGRHHNHFSNMGARLTAKQPISLKKVHDELDVHMGRDQQVDESDVRNLVYLQAVVNETLCLYPAGPLALPHEAMEDFQIGGFDIPAGTRLMVINGEPLEVAARPKCLGGPLRVSA